MLIKLNNFMFTQKNLNNYYNNLIYSNLNLENKTKKDKIDKNKSSKKDLNFIVSQKDQLFWIFYIFLFGYEEYHLIQNYFITEKNFKINSIIKLREHKDLLKINKISKSLVENELLNEEIISIKTFNCLALLYKLNIIYIKDRIIFIMNYNNEKIINCKNIIEEKNNKLNIINLSSEVINDLIDTYFNIININKPINAISYYKLDDLIKIAKQLNLDIKNKQKKEIYALINNSLSL